MGGGKEGENNSVAFLLTSSVFFDHIVLIYKIYHQT